MEIVIQEKILLVLGNIIVEKKQELEVILGLDFLKEVVLNCVLVGNNINLGINKDFVLEKISQVILFEVVIVYLGSQKIFEEIKQFVQIEIVLKEQKRCFLIEIGEIESQFQKVDVDLKQCEELICQKNIFEIVIMKIDQQLNVLVNEKMYDVINDLVLMKIVLVIEE